MQNIVRTYIAAIQLHAANKRKDIKSNNVLETFLEQFKEKDFNKKFKSIDRELFKLIKDEAHIYLSDGDKTKIINYFKYLRINYKYLKQLTKMKAQMHQRQRRRKQLQHHYQQQQLQHLLPHQTITVITLVVAMKVSLMRRMKPSITTISFPIRCNMSIIGLM